MSSKVKLNTALRAGAGTTSVAYGYTKKAKPYIVFNLVSHVGTRLSGQRHSQRMTWQVDYYSNNPFDMQNSQLNTIQEILEQHQGITSEWIEIITVDEETELTEWRYMLEVVI